MRAISKVIRRKLPARWAMVQRWRAGESAKALAAEYGTWDSQIRTWAKHFDTGRWPTPDAHETVGKILTDASPKTAAGGNVRDAIIFLRKAASLIGTTKLSRPALYMLLALDALEHGS
jgi:hypothetical protein